MRIPVHNWETGNFEDVEYPDSLFEPFLKWLLSTHAWEEDPKRVNRHVLILQREMAEYRARPREVTKRYPGLEKARAAKKAKREAVHA